MLRLALALGVLAQHLSGATLGFWLTPNWRGASVHWLSGHPWPIGNMSVIGFFMLSGFLVQEISRRYELRYWRGYVRFLLARCARIYPLYWAVLLPTLLAWAVIDGVSLYPLPKDFLGQLLLWPLVWTAQIRHAFLFDFTAPWLGPSWTLAVDLLCYPIGGLLAGRVRLILPLLLLCVASIPLEGVVFYTSLQENLAIFLLGMLARQYADRILCQRSWVLVGVWMLWMYAWATPFGMFLGLQVAVFVATFPVLLSHGFRSRRTGLDRLLGNSTYALYLVQYPAISALKPFLDTMGELRWMVWVLIVVAALTIVFTFVESCFERWRYTLIVKSDGLLSQGARYGN
mgnify:CR=1 FL=1